MSTSATVAGQGIVEFCSPPYTYHNKHNYIVLSPCGFYLSTTLVYILYFILLLFTTCFTKYSKRFITITCANLLSLSSHNNPETQRLLHNNNNNDNNDVEGEEDDNTSESNETVNSTSTTTTTKYLELASSISTLKRSAFVFVFTILSSHIFDLFWVLLNLNSKNNNLILLQLLIATTTLSWLIHFYIMLYTKIPNFAKSIHLFWVVGFIIGTTRLYHIIIYWSIILIDNNNNNNNTDIIPYSDLITNGTLLTFCIRYCINGLLLFFIGIDIILAYRTSKYNSPTTTTTTSNNTNRIIIGQEEEEGHFSNNISNNNNSRFQHVEGGGNSAAVVNSSSTCSSRNASNVNLIPSHYQNTTKLPTTFTDFYKHFVTLVPFLWPSGSENIFLKLLLVCSILVIILGRVVNLFVPIMYKDLVNSLGGVEFNHTTATTSNLLFDIINVNNNNNSSSMFSTLSQVYENTSITIKINPTIIPWGQISLFVLFRFLQGKAGFLSNLEDFLWIPVGQSTTRSISVKMFTHMHSLSLRYHINRKTGEILRVQDRGVSSIVSLLESICFNILPTLVDILVACIYFTIYFDMYFGFVVFTTMTMYIFFTVLVTEWRTRYRRWANLLDNEMEARAVDSLLNFETVKYYSAEDLEILRYRNAVLEYQKADLLSMLSLAFLQNIQNFIIQIGLFVGCALCAKRIIYDGTLNVGDLVLYLSYITQLYGPLNYFGSYYRQIQKNFVDMENMLDLFDEVPEIRDIPNAPPLVVKSASVEFQNVCFDYEERAQTLKNVSFLIPSGKTVALVGPSGSGKSTILRLLFRFYDIQSGRILIDGQDIQKVQQKSVRKIIGVVPQDTVLFNDTIEYNISYGRPSATREEVYGAAADAQIHEKILQFPDGYDTKVGERGLRLSGGEKQRVAIARTLLKDPAIVLLDEATSALDTQTERAIQNALNRVTLNRTTLVIAHRLSTVVNADLILVLRDGEIVERGSHETLMKDYHGIYRDMWIKQKSYAAEGSTTTTTTTKNNSASSSSSSSNNNNNKKKSSGGGNGSGIGNGKKHHKAGTGSSSTSHTSSIL